MKIKLLARRALWIIPMFAFISYWTMNRVVPVLPKILGDELVYSLDSRKLAPADSQITNYLYNLIFSSTNLCANNFYGCAKALNLVFLLALGVVVYLTARLFANEKPSIFIALLTVFGPISAYVSYFTPDIASYFTVALIIYFAVQLRQSSHVLRWVLLGFGVAISALIKPHALFLLLPLLIYAGYLSKKETKLNWSKLLSRSFALVASTFFLKLSVGFAFAGTRGLGLFGGSYDSATKNLLGQTAQKTSETAISGEASGSNPSATWSLSNAAWIGNFAVDLALSLFFVLIFFGVPFLLTLNLKNQGGELSEDSNSEPTDLSKLRLLVYSVLATFILVSAGYVAVSRSWGEILDNRVMVRYYEHILVFLPLLLVANVESKAAVKKKFVAILVTASILFFAVGAWAMSYLVPPLFADSSLFASVIQSGFTIYPLAVLSLTLFLISIFRPATGKKGWLIVFMPIVTLVFVMGSFLNLTVKDSVADEYTTSARWVHSNLNSDQIQGMQVFGTIRSQVLSAQFWIDDPSVIGTTVKPGTTVDVSHFKNGSYLLVIDNVKLIGTGLVVNSGRGYNVIQIVSK